MLRRTCFFLLLVLASLSAAAETTDPFAASLHENSFVGFHPNTFGIAVDHGEQRFQFQLSLRYQLLGLQDWGLALGPYRLRSLNLGYDGLYDFFLWTRASQPLVSRDQNPGLYLHFDAPLEARHWHLDAFDAGWFHESNGQVVDTLAAYQTLLAQEGPSANEKISRAWDYWSLAPRFSFQPFSSPTQFRIRFDPALRLYTGAQGVILPAEQAIFWRPQDPPSTIYDYDGLRARLSFEWLLPWRALNYIELSADTRTGYRPEHLAQAWSQRFALTCKLWQLPFYAYYDNGYGPYISDYSSPSEGYGFGLRVW